ncbi:MAG: NAD(P)-dependent alcohol dehydrogenase [Peptococcaceae bacterium]|jgi:aryl-alcohol dehydrogenase|nr:NAD(P)-dependent alcohol dehydrogenase [Peptococcaceae bacterium]
MFIKAAVTYGKGAPFVVKEVELSEPRERDVLIKMASCGVCHTDADARDHGSAPLPIVLGHEGAGVVEKVGSAVKTVKPGDHVVLTQNFCGVCEYCRAGHPSSCVRVPDYNFSGVYPDGDTRLTDSDGSKLHAYFSQSSFASFAIADENNTVKIDGDMDLTLAGPLGCGVQTGAGTVLNALQAEAGSSVAVFGCGAVGLSAIMAAKISGCSEIIGIDSVPERLSLARELGATHTVNGRDTPDISGEIIRYTGSGAHYSVECSGAADLVTASMYCLTRRGTCALVGSMGDQIIPLKLMEAVFKGSKRVMGVIEGDSVPHTFIPKLVRYYKAGVFPFDKLIRFYDLEDINQAFEDSRKGKTIKPVIRF